MKTALAKYSFMSFSALIATWAFQLLQGQTWLVWLLGLLAAASAIWALAGLYNPNALFFADKRSKTRENAFSFPMRLFFTFAFFAWFKTIWTPDTFDIFTLSCVSTCLVMAFFRAADLAIW
ncbi:MAG: hypothetical protein FWH25_04525 [Syntrophorhabdaceae bacterium]|nr:hypothetical protein [Syntrophorhabdaceae bacterium]